MKPNVNAFSHKPNELDGIWNCHNTRCPYPRQTRRDHLTSDTQLKEMEPLLASIKRIENRFGIEVERPFTKSEHDLYKSLYRFDADINAKNIDSWLIIAEDMQATRYKGGRFTAGCDVDPIYCPTRVQTSTVEVIPHAFEMMNRHFYKTIEIGLKQPHRLYFK